MRQICEALHISSHSKIAFHRLTHPEFLQIRSGQLALLLVAELTPFQPLVLRTARVLTVKRIRI